MTTEVASVGPEASAAEAARLMRDINAGVVPVCSPGRHVVGVVTDRDLALGVCAEDGKPSSVRVGDLMIRDLKTVGPEDTVEVVEEMMAMYRTSRVLVVDRDGDLLGVVSLSDVAADGGGERAGETLRRLSARPKRPGVPTT